MGRKKFRVDRHAGGGRPTAGASRRGASVVLKAGGGHAGKPGSSGPADWSCPSCEYVNHGWRASCRKGCRLGKGGAGGNAPGKATVPPTPKPKGSQKELPEAEAEAVARCRRLEAEVLGLELEPLLFCRGLRAMHSLELFV